MIQYNGIKGKYLTTSFTFLEWEIFMKLFGEDAYKSSKILGIVLTNRSNGSSKIELAAFHIIQ